MKITLLKNKYINICSDGCLIINYSNVKINSKKTLNYKIKENDLKSIQYKLKNDKIKSRILIDINYRKKLLVL